VQQFKCLCITSTQQLPCKDIAKGIHDSGSGTLLFTLYACQGTSSGARAAQASFSAGGVRCSHGAMQWRATALARERQV
jgi:hypothetical protein